MSYLAFQLKKVFKNKLTPVCLAILLLLMGIVLFMNIRTNPQFSLQAGAKSEIAYCQKEINRQQRLLKHDKQKSKTEVYHDTKAAIKQNQDAVKQDKQVQKAANKGNWRKAYTIMWQQKKQEQTITSNGQDSTGLNSRTNVEKKLQFFNYLRHEPLPYESQDMPVTGWQFLLQLNQQYLPYVFTLVALFLLTLLLTDSYHQKLDTAQLLPLEKNNLMISNTIAGIVLTLGSFLGINLVLFIVASLISGTGSLSFPYIVVQYTVSGPLIKCVTTGSFIIKVIVLQALTLIFDVVLVQFLARIFRDKLPALLIAILLVPGLNIATMIVDSLRKICAWLPMTYLNAVDIVSGNLGMNYQNVQLNFTTGLLTLCCSILIIAILILLSSHIKYKE